MRGVTRDGIELEAIPLPPARHGEVTTRQFARVTFHVALIESAGAVPPSGRIEVSAVDSARILDGLLSRLDAAPRQLANLIPRYVDFRCVDDGAEWIRPLDIDRGGLRGGPVWLRITPDGETREVRLPDRFDPYRFTSGKIRGAARRIRCRLRGVDHGAAHALNPWPASPARASAQGDSCQGDLVRSRAVV